MFQFSSFPETRLNAIFIVFRLPCSDNYLSFIVESEELDAVQLQLLLLGFSLGEFFCSL